MFMGFSSCTGLKKWKEPQTVMLVIREGELTVNSGTFAASQDSISNETLVLGQIQHTASVQPLSGTPQDWKQESYSLEVSSLGAHAERVVGFHQIQRIHIIDSAIVTINTAQHTVEIHRRD